MATDNNQDEINNMKKALRIDGNDDDTMLANYLQAAKAYVQHAVQSDTDLTKYRQYEFAVQMLAQFYYQNRGTDMVKTPYQVLSMIQQLRGQIN